MGFYLDPCCGKLEITGNNKEKYPKALGIFLLEAVVNCPDHGGSCPEYRNIKNGWVRYWNLHKEAWMVILIRACNS